MFDWFKKRTKSPEGPDFSAVDSKAKAEELFRNGTLQKLLLLPEDFGGQDVEPNVVYVPAFVVEAKARIDGGIIRKLINEGQIQSYAAEPEYEGRSFVPCAIRIVASNPGKFTTDIRIWGKALTRT